MITEDWWLYMTRILRDHGNAAQGRGRRLGRGLRSRPERGGAAGEDPGDRAGERAGRNALDHGAVVGGPLREQGDDVMGGRVVVGAQVVAGKRGVLGIDT